MELLRTIIFFLILGLVCAILIIILINAIRRTFFNSTQHNRMGQGQDKCVDLFAFNVSSLPLENVLPGMTALIDRGSANLETGIYILEGDQQWSKIHVPEVGDRFRILRGESAGKHYTIRPSYVYDIRPPTETQIIDNDHLYQELQETTDTILVTPSVRLAPHVTVNTTAQKIKHSSAFPLGRTLTIVNTSPAFAFTLVVNNNENVVVQAKSVRMVHLSVTDALEPYHLGAVSD